MSIVTGVPGLLGLQALSVDPIKIKKDKNPNNPGHSTTNSNLTSWGSSLLSIIPYLFLFSHSENPGTKHEYFY